jgi:hypothetical protein
MNGHNPNAVVPALNANAINLNSACPGSRNIKGRKNKNA